MSSDNGFQWTRSWKAVLVEKQMHESSAEFGKLVFADYFELPKNFKTSLKYHYERSYCLTSLQDGWSAR